jgi:hypothetical protein
MPIGSPSKDEPDDLCQESCQVDHERHEPHQDWEGHDDCERSAPPSDSVGTASKRSETFDLAFECPLVVVELREADTVVDVLPWAAVVGSRASPAFASLEPTPAT